MTKEDELRQEGYKWLECRDCPFLDNDCTGIEGDGGCYVHLEQDELVALVKELYIALAACVGFLYLVDPKHRAVARADPLLARTKTFLREEEK